VYGGGNDVLGMRGEMIDRDEHFGWNPPGLLCFSSDSIGRTEPDTFLVSLSAQRYSSGLSSRSAVRSIVTER
jgi:hypothetical protein